MENQDNDNDDNVDQIDTTDISDTKDYLIINKGWNDNNERLIVSLGENAASYKWMHEKCSTMYSKYAKILGIIIIFFNALLSAETLFTFTTTTTDCNQITVFDISQKLTVWIVTILSIIQNFLNLEKTIAKHNNSAVLFSDLYHDIQKQMCLYRKDRFLAVKYISSVMKKYDNLEINGPDINSRILAEFKKKFNNKINMPNIADSIQKIDIITEPSNFMTKSDIESNGHDIDHTKYTFNGMSNLSKMNSCFRIDGDLTEKDDISRFVKAKNEYEMNRFEG